MDVLGFARAWAEAWARSGTVATIAGVALLRFGADGRVVAQSDYWSSADGSTELYESWARS